MARPLVRHGGVQQGVSEPGAALAATGRHPLVRKTGNLLIAWDGRFQFNDLRLARRAAEGGTLDVLAQEWRTAPALLCAAMHGSFVLAILDPASGDALLAVDRAATMPLWWMPTGGGLVFASSCDAIRAHTALEADPQALYDYVHCHVVPGPHSAYRGVQRLNPGEFLTLRGGGASVGTYWKMSFDEGAETSLDELQEEFRALLRASMGRAIVHAGEVGAFLSGGTDSSTMAGILSQVSGEPARTYSIGFRADGYDETAYARMAARHFATRHHEFYVTPADVLAAIPAVAEAFDQPFGNASALPAYYCARLAAADGIDTLVGGDGGDELFGGNERYAHQRVFELYHRLPFLLRAGLLEPAAAGLPAFLPLVRKARSYIAQSNTPMPARLDSNNLLACYGPEAVFTADFLARVDPLRPAREQEELYARCGAHTLVNRMLALDWKVTLADNDLPKVRGACALAGIEAAFPLLDAEMVDFAARLAPRLKLNRGRLRWFFKHALRDFLPPQVIAKRKHGFGLPFGVWLQQDGGLRDCAGDSLASLRGRGIIRPEFVDALLARHLREHAAYHGTMVWVLMMLEQWFRRSLQGSPARRQAASAHSP
jgi:asparagine synthase (glutamine-hydrolysing)